AKIQKIHIAKNIDFDELRRGNMESTKEMYAVFDNAINSKWTPGKTKFYYEMFQIFIEQNGRATHNFLYLVEWVNNLKEAITTLWTEIQQIKGVDIENVTERMNKLLDEPAVQIVGKILEDEKEAIKKIDERRRKLIKDSIV
ncbi:MAG TPA: hypothetical protein VF893_08725, partial [Candidatus Bathyarchaeia archaeon]